MTGDRTDGPTVRRNLPSGFESLAHLFSPEDPCVGTLVIDAGDEWALPSPPDAGVEVILWGRLPRNERPTLDTLAFATRREAALLSLRLRRSAGFRVAELYRLPPVSRPGAVKRVIRSAALGGVLAELDRGAGQTRVIDAVATAAGATTLLSGVRPSGDGSALARIGLADGSRAELRVSRVGHPKDPERGRAALLAMQRAQVPLVPRPIRSGTTAGAAWATETSLTGAHVESLSARLLEEVTAFLARLPAGTSEASAVDDQVAMVADAFPGHAEALRAAAAAAGRWGQALPPVLVHGDLWVNNIFVADGRLSGIFDWDTWHPAGLPGIDLLNLIAAEARMVRRHDFGPLLVDEVWRWPKVVDALRPYFATRAVAFPDRAGLAAIGVAWWASRLAGSLHRASRPVEDPAWIRRNVDEVLDKIERLERDLG